MTQQSFLVVVTFRGPYISPGSTRSRESALLKWHFVLTLGTRRQAPSIFSPRLPSYLKFEFKTQRHNMLRLTSGNETCVHGKVPGVR